ncbi:response regulator transcription factor [soil metagenome]
MRLLVVEDEVDLADAVVRGLRREGYAVDVVHDGAAALDVLGVHAYDLVCLDLGLPDMDGLALCRRLRDDPSLLADEDAPPRVLMLTARDTLGDRVAGLDTGADDYLVKPFAFPELSARVRTLLRRDAGRTGSVLVVADLTLDTARATVDRAGHPLDLSPKEFALLRYLMARPGQVLSQEHLLEHVWDAFADPFTNTVRVTIGTLRRKLDPAGADQPIETVVGQGYRLRDAGRAGS